MGLKDFFGKFEKDLSDSMVKLTGWKKESLPTGSMALDFVLDGGWTRNRIHEIFGENQSGKTTIAIETMVQEQRIVRGLHPDIPKRDGGIMFFDFEHALDPLYAKYIGLDIDDSETFMLFQPKHANEMAAHIDRVKDFAKEKGKCPVSLMIIDSLAAMRPVEEIEKTTEEVKKFKGLHARTCTDFFNKYTGVLAELGITVLVMNQTRSSISMGGSFGHHHEPNWGWDEETTGGNAPKFYFSSRLRLEVYDFKETQFHSILMGHDTRVKELVRGKASAVKNKAGMAHRTDYYIIRFGKGIDNFETVLSKGINFGIIVKSGAWFKLFEGTKITEDGTLEIIDTSPSVLSAQGEEGFKQKLKENQQAYLFLRKLVTDKYKRLKPEEIYGKAIIENDVDEAAMARSMEKKKPEELSPSSGKKEVIE